MSKECTLTKAYRICKERLKQKSSTVLIKCGAQMVCLLFPNLKRLLFKENVPKYFGRIFIVCRQTLFGM